MLRRFHIGRFAYNRPPHGESRLLGFADQQNQNAQNAEEGPESSGPSQEAGPISTSEGRSNVLAIVPEAVNEEIGEMEHSNDIFLSATERDAGLQEKITTLLRENFGLQFDPSAEGGFDRFIESVPADVREKSIRLLLKDPENALALDTALKQRMDRYEETLRIVERNLKTVFDKVADPGQVAAIIEGQLAANKVSSLDRNTVMERLNLQSLSQDEQEAVFGPLEDAYKAKQKQLRYALSNRSADAPDMAREERSQFLTGYLSTLQKQREALAEYTDAVLWKRAQAVLKRDRQSFAETFQDLATVDRTNIGPEMEKVTQEKFGTSAVTVVSLFDARSNALEKIGTGEVQEVNGQPTKFIDRAHQWKLLTTLERESARDLSQQIEERKKTESAMEQWAKSAALRVRTLRTLHGHTWDPIIQEVTGIDPEQMLSELEHYVDPYAEGDPETLRKDPTKNIATGLMPWEVERFEQYLQGLERDDFAQELAKHKALETAAQSMPAAEVPQLCDEAAGELTQALNTLLPSPALSHRVCQTVGVASALEKKKQEILEMLRRARKSGEAYMLLQAQSEIQKISSCTEEFAAIEQTVEYRDFPAEENVNGFYDYATKTIIINQKISPARKRSALNHEKGHAILDILVRRTALLPNLLWNPYEESLQEKTGSDGRSFQEMLRSLGASWKIEQQKPRWEERYRAQGMTAEAAHAKAEKQYTHALLDELVNKHASWVEAGRPELRARDPEKRKLKRTETELYRLLEEEPSRRVPDESEQKLYQTQEEEEEEQVVVTAQSNETANLKEELVKIARNIQVMKSFRDAYKSELGEEVLLVPIQKSEAMEKRLSEIFMGKDPRISNPEENPEYINAIRKLFDYTDGYVTKIRDIDAEKLDITKEEKSAPGFFATIRFMSVLDFVKLYKDTAEDITTMYKRRQDRLLKDVGDVFTGMFPDNLGKYIPIAGTYAAGLKQFHRRRYSGAETETVQKWEDGLKNEDSHTLLHVLADTKNKDQIKGIINLLTGRGEMDWNNRGVMLTMRKLSGFNMPVEACLRDDVLRDTWYRKMVTEIWADKELYYGWRSTNDDKVESGKKHFTTLVDQFSNVKGGMSNELRKQLRLQIEWLDSRHGGEHVSPPEDIKPHLYEEILHYAIRNGKMTMEQKFYYLVQGVAYGILSIDRLRALAGEHGGVLNQFPFIDYFYQRNNTLPQVQALAKRLTETGTDGKSTFKPGGKTTLWLQLEVAREQSVQERLSKGTAKANAENIDHEDIPFFITQLDYNNGVRNLADIISGSRQKVSPEGWKNAYVGYSSKFRIFGRLAQMQEEGLDRFTVNDARMLGQTITSYIDMDNILTRNGLFKDGRPTLSEYQMEGLPVSGDGSHTTREYRSAVNSFIGSVIRAYGPELEEHPAWQSTGLTLEQYAGTDGRFNRGLSPEDAKKVDPATKAFVRAFDDIVRKDPMKLKSILIRHADHLFDEGGSSADGGISLEKVRKIYKQRESEVAHGSREEAIGAASH